MEILTTGGAAAAEFLPAVARLRIAVFREFPYLYDGSEDYEHAYLSRYVNEPGSVLVVAIAKGEVVGASTGLPLTAAGDEFLNPWIAAGEPVGEVFYLGESVLLQPFRGRGIGHQFFNAREAHAQQLGLAQAAFCAVDRAPDHPLRPAGYRPHDAFWQKRGYQRDARLVARLAWQQVDAPVEVENPLTFWRRWL